MKDKFEGSDELESEEDDTTAIDILKGLMDAESDLELKTHVIVPKDIAGLQVLVSVLKMYELDGSSKLLETFITYYLKLMVSYQRKGRKEIVDAVSGLMERERSLKFSQRLSAKE